MRHFRQLTFFVAVTGACACAASAQAGFMHYTNLAAWQAAAGGSPTLEDFSGATVGFSTSDYPLTSFNGFTLSSVANGDSSGIATGTISSSGDSHSIPVAFTSQNFYGWGNGDGNLGPTTTLTFAAGTTAFGFDWFNTDGDDNYKVIINNGGGSYQKPPFILYGQGSDHGFWGFVADGGDTFTTATFEHSAQGGYISTMGIDNVRVSATSLTGVPEPETLALFAVGLGVLEMMRRKKAA